ncbi:MAG: hypothetical protein A2167_07505 [Planctomycetes bacterium RBG_13_46_10]|nr:MAG: hypothetical protein A2167_07505 [Planctomycetes bacterium RBG_13_46_10]
MSDEHKSKAELLQELNTLRKRICELEQTNQACGELVESNPNNLEKQFRELSENIPVGVYRTTPDGRIIMANSSLVQMLGFSSFQELSRRNVEKVGFAPGYPRSTFKKLIEKDGKVAGLESAWIRRDGTTLFIIENARAIRDESGKTLYYEGIVQNITKLKKAEEALRESEQRYRTLTESAQDHIFIVDKQRNIKYANPYGAKELGKHPEQFIGKPLDRLFPPEVSETPLQNIEKVFKSGKPLFGVKDRIKLPDREIWIDTNVIPIRNAEGQVEAVMGISRDITELKKMEQALRESQKWQRAILDTIPDMAWLKDNESKYIAANEALCKAFGIRFEDFVGKTDLDISPKDLAEKYRADDQEVIKSGRRKLTEEPWGKKQGERIWIETIKTPIYNDQGQIIGTSGIARDITERKKLERALMESEAKHRTLVEQIPAITYIAALDEASTTTYVSPQIQQILGFSPADYKADPDIWRKQLHSDDRQRVLAELQRCHESGESFACEYRMHTKDGRTVWLRDEARIVRDNNGNPLHLQGVMYDITERRKAEEQIRALSSAVEQSIDGIAIGDLEPRLLYVNEAYARMHGFTPEEIIGMPVKKLHSKEQRDTFNTDINLIKSLGFWEGEIGHIKKDGTPFPTYMSTTLLKDSEGKPIGLLAVARDITEVKRREDELNNYRRKIARSEQLASMGALSAGLAHELNQPLTVINLLVENLLMNMEAEKERGPFAEKLQDVLNEVSRVASIARRFRDVARRVSEKVVSRVDLKSVAQRILKLFDESARRAKVDLILKGFNKLPTVDASEEDLGQLFFALIQNAVQAADGKQQHRLVISSAVKNGHIELRFADNCGGMPPENLSRIFDPFFTTKPVEGATGLGLCIVEHIVSRAEGRIDVESKLGKGTTFSITLPIKSHSEL